MKVAYLDCSTGISGDMTLGALIDAGVDKEAIRHAIDALGLKDVQLQVTTVVKGGFRATKVDVLHPEQHAHRHLSDIRHILDQAGSALLPRQRDLAMRIFLTIAEAEAHVHGMSVEKVHFHEVGAIDSIVDIVGAAVGFDLLGADRIVCSRIPTGQGQVQIDHGLCTVPTPGTAEILKGIPLIHLPVDAELTTPTGAAIVKTMADEFGALPNMTIRHIGYGAGTMDLPGRANLLRLIVGDGLAAPYRDIICLLETNLDDLSGEIIGHTKQALLDEGALDVFCSSIQMKKDRPGVLLSLICRPCDADRLEQILFRQTGTLGIRRSLMERSKQARQPHQVSTPWGTVQGKLAWLKGQAPDFSPEYESCARLAREAGVPLRDVYRAAVAAYDPEEAKPLLRNKGSSATAPETATPSHDHDHDDGHG